MQNNIQTVNPVLVTETTETREQLIARIKKNASGLCESFEACTKAYNNAGSLIRTVCGEIRRVAMDPKTTVSMRDIRRLAMEAFDWPESRVSETVKIAMSDRPVFDRFMIGDNSFRLALQESRAAAPRKAGSTVHGQRGSAEVCDALRKYLLAYSGPVPVKGMCIVTAEKLGVKFALRVKAVKRKASKPKKQAKAGSREHAKNLRRDHHEAAPSKA